MSLLKSWWKGSAPAEDGEEKGEGDTDVTKEKVKESEGEARGASDSGPTKDNSNPVNSWMTGIGNLVSSVSDYANNLRETVTTTVQSSPILSEFEEEQKKFERERQRQRDTAVPPWVGYNEEEQIKAQILELSADSRNVLRNPPPGIQFHFDFAKSFPVALALLKEDPRLQKLRFELVPKKIKEERFWHNFFYRVFLIKQSAQLASLSSAEHGSTSSPLPQEASEQPEAVSSTASLGESFTDVGTHEHQDASGEDFASDALVMADGKEETISRESVRAELDQLGVEEQKNVDVVGSEEWEQELEKELEDMGLQIEGEDEEGVALNINEGDEEQWENDLKLILESHSPDKT